MVDFLEIMAWARPGLISYFGLRTWVSRRDTVEDVKVSSLLSRGHKLGFC